jgi:hypothetical protein
LPNTVTPTSTERSSKLLHQHRIVQKKKNTENYYIFISFLHPTDKFINTGVMASQKFWQWSDNIKPKDDITPFDGIFFPFPYISPIDHAVFGCPFQTVTVLRCMKMMIFTLGLNVHSSACKFNDFVMNNPDNCSFNHFFFSSIFYQLPFSLLP